MTIKPGSKYYPLFEHLQRCQHPETALTFAEIEAIIDKPLPTSARSKRNWWSNRDSASALQAGAWISAAYQVNAVDLEQQTVTFHKFEASYHIERKTDGEIVWHQDAIKALRKHMKLTQAQFAEELGVRRQTVSEWENGVYDPDRSKLKFLELIAKQANFQPPSDHVPAEQS
ncbi:MAG: helix-turn-helix transcriptional regulator [Cyanobacteria bacterium P01_A01_bin.123]